MNKEVISLLMDELRMQHAMRLEEYECGGDEIIESFDSLKKDIVDKLLKAGFSDFKTLEQIQLF